MQPTFLVIYIYLSIYLFIIHRLPVEGKFHEGRGACQLSSPLYPKCLGISACHQEVSNAWIGCRRFQLGLVITVFCRVYNNYTKKSAYSFAHIFEGKIRMCIIHGKIRYLVNSLSFCSVFSFPYFCFSWLPSNKTWRQC